MRREGKSAPSVIGDAKSHPKSRLVVFVFRGKLVRNVRNERK